MNTIISWSQALHRSKFLILLPSSISGKVLFEREWLENCRKIGREFHCCYLLEHHVYEKKHIELCGFLFGICNEPIETCERVEECT